VGLFSSSCPGHFITLFSVFGKPPSPSLENYTLADMAFLSSLSYRSTSIIKSGLEGWFGPSGMNVTDEFSYVNEWKEVAGGPSSQSAVFRLFRFPSESGNIGVVSVRGTASPLDLLVDNQLWQAAMLAQAVRAVLPFGEIFTPMLPSESFS
jgi:lipase ATG15